MSPKEESSKIDIVISIQEKSKETSLNSSSQEIDHEIKESQPSDMPETINTSPNATSKQSTISSKKRSIIGSIKRAILNIWNSIKKFSVMDLIQLISLVILTRLLIASLTINKLKNSNIWEVELWRCCVLLLVIFSGNLFSKLVRNLITFLIHKINVSINNKVIYFIYVIVSSSTILIWLGLIMVVWLVLIRERVGRSLSTDEEKRIIHKITRGMLSSLAGFCLWFMKTYLIKLLASSFQMNKLFGRVQDAIFFKFVVQQLEKFKNDGTFDKEKKIDGEYEWEYVEKLYETKQDDVFAIYMTRLIEKLSIKELLEMKKIEFKNKSESKADGIVVNIENHDKKGYINTGKFDALPGKASARLRRLFEVVEPSTVLSTEPSKNSSEIQINKSEFKTWMIVADKELRNLACSLEDSNSATDELNVIASILVLVVIVIIWLLLMGITTTEVLVFISSQIVVWSFVFSDTLKIVLDGVVFNFVVHPFDVGDECYIDGQKMTVEEMGLLSTEFQGIIEENDDDKQKNGKMEIDDTQENGKKGNDHKQKNAKIHYSNSVLAGMRIINFSKASSQDEVSRIWK